MLEDLHEYIEEIVRNFDASLYAEDRELPNEFKNYILDHPDGKSYVFNKFTTIIHTDLDIYSPNQWFYIAAYYCKIYPLLQKYRELSIQALCKGLDQTAQKDLFSKASSRHDEIFAAFDIAGYDSDTKEKLWNFVSDYNWWRGGKGIERNDFYYSPILSAAQLVNQSQSYVAEICKYLISNPDALTILNEGIGSSVISQTQLFEETNIAKFMGQCMEEFLNYDSNISQADKYLQKNAVTVGFKKCPFGYLKSKADSETDPRRFDDCNKNITWYFNGQVYYFWKEQSSEKLEIFKNTFNIIYKTIYYIDINGGIYRLYKISKSKIANKLSFSPLDEPLQKIVYGAPGTGKSHGTDKIIKKYYPNREVEKDFVFRTTFHPDSDYSTFVGCYKPTTIPTPRVSGYIDDSATSEEKNQLTYEFVPQSFTKAYVAAWKTKLEGENKPVFLVIEEINRGNCAQIFGDLFQLLDRKNGFSEYPIKPDTDLGNYLREEFQKARLTSDEYKAVVDGEELILPSNLYIWATMNTSDQSLFPIDSAFKRRWDWEYRPINHEAQSGWVIVVDGKPYSWSSFLEKINKEIEETTSSEDKQLGFFFCKAEDTDKDNNNGTISAEKFVSKVLFYLYNDVFKDYDYAREFFKHKDGENKGKVITFRNLYQMDGKINEEVVAELLNNLGVEEIKSTSNEDDQNFDSDTIDAGMKEHKETLVAVTIDGERLTADGTTQFDLYLNAIKKMGIARIAPVIESMKYRRKSSPMATKTQVQGVLDSSDYSYVEAEGYYFVKGANGYTLIRILEDLNENLSLNIKVEYK